MSLLRGEPGYDDNLLAPLSRPAPSNFHLDTGSIERLIVGIALRTLEALPERCTIFIAVFAPPRLHEALRPRTRGLDQDR